MPATASLDARRTVRRHVLRLQGRLDSDRSDRFLPWLLAAGATLLLALCHAAANRSLNGGGGLAPWLQAGWRRTHGGAGTPLAGTDPASGSPVSEVVLLLGRLVGAETAFVTLQALAIGLAVVPLWRLARTEAHLRVGATCAIVVAFVLAPTLHRANLGGFHPELLAVPAIFEAYRQGLNRRWWRVALLTLFIVCCRPDLGLTVAALGGYFATTGRRRAGLSLGAFGVLWTLGALLVLRPDLPDERLSPAGEFVHRATGPLAAVGELLTDPLTSLGTMLAEPSVQFVVVILAPLIFLPMMTPRRLAIALPGLLLALLADEAVQRNAERGVLDLAPAGAHIGPVVAVVFLALVFALERIGVPSVTRVNVDRRVLLSLLSGAVLLFVIEAPTSPYRRPWAWGGRDAADGARLAAVELVPEDAAVAASPSVIALVAERAVVVELPPVPTAIDAAHADALAGDGIDYVVLDTGARVAADGTVLWSETSRERAVGRLEASGYEQVGAVGDVLVLTRAGAAAPADG